MIQLADRLTHYQRCAEHEGRRVLQAMKAKDVRAAYHHARDAAHWAGRVLALREKDPDEHS